jgi:choline kinase
MKAVLMAAGKGSRLQPLTNDRPKSLLEIDGKPLLIHQIEMLKENGVRDFIIVTGYRADQVEKAVAHFSGIQLVHNPFYEHCNVLGSFYLTLPYLNDGFVYAHADTLFEMEILKRVLEGNGEIRLAVDDHPCGEEEMKVLIEGAKITHLSKLLPAERVQGEFIGMGFVAPSMLPSLKKSVQKLIHAGKKDQYFEAALQDLIDNGSTVAPVDVTGLVWNEIDFIEDYERLKSRWNSRRS